MLLDPLKTFPGLRLSDIFLSYRQSVKNLPHYDLVFQFTTNALKMKIWKHRKCLENQNVLVLHCMVDEPIKNNINILAGTNSQNICY